MLAGKDTAPKVIYYSRDCYTQFAALSLRSALMRAGRDGPLFPGPLHNLTPPPVKSRSHKLGHGWSKCLDVTL